MLIVSGARAGHGRVRDPALLGAVDGHEHAFRVVVGRLALDAVELQEAVLGTEAARGLRGT